MSVGSVESGGSAAATSRWVGSSDGSPVAEVVAVCSVALGSANGGLGERDREADGAAGVPVADLAGVALVWAG